MLKDKTKNLAQLIVENPDLPIVFMVNNSECLDCDEYSTTVHCPSYSKVGTIAHYGETFYDDPDDLREDIEYYVSYDESSDDDLERIVEERLSEIVWHKAIIVGTQAFDERWLED